MPESIPSKTQAQMLAELYEMIGLVEDPPDKDLIVEVKWLLEAQFRVVIAACEKYNDTPVAWETYLNETLVPGVVDFLKEKLDSEKILVGTTLQDAINTLQGKAEADKARLRKVEENIVLFGGVL